MENEYKNENLIVGHGNPISFIDLRKLDVKSENSMCKIEYDGKKGSAFFFKQNIEKIKYYNKLFLMTNNHILDSNFINNYNELTVLYKNQEKIIPLKNRIKKTNIDLDYTMIEIKENEIEDFFEIDNYIMNNNDNYLKKDIYIVQYPEGKDLSFAQGEIKSIESELIKHSVSTLPGSSGSPILIQNNNKFKIIGLHKQGGNKGKKNLGCFMKDILNDINEENKIDYNNKNNISFEKTSFCKIKKGINLFGRCPNPKCEAYKKEVCHNFGFGTFDLIKDLQSNNNKCPKCPSCKFLLYEVENCGFMKCKYHYIGKQLIENKTIVKIDKNNTINDENKLEYIYNAKNGENNNFIWIELKISANEL